MQTAQEAAGERDPRDGLWEPHLAFHHLPLNRPVRSTDNRTNHHSQTQTQLFFSISILIATLTNFKLQKVSIK